jgi:hypothetical protein
MYEGIDPKGYDIEKWKVDFLLRKYEFVFAPLVGQSISLLELGIYKGASLRFWRDYFENATVVGLDCNPPVKIDDPNGRIHIYQGYQQDTQILDRIVKEQAPDGFDVVIDDCSHIGRVTRISFWHLFQNHLKPGGLYAIEDWGTGYVESWPDGRRYRPKSHLRYSLYERSLDSVTSNLSRAFPHFLRLADIVPGLAKIVPRLVKIRGLFITSTIPSHTHGMVGFVKELLDACALGERATPRSGPGRYSDYGISQLYIDPRLVIVSKSKEKDASKTGTLLPENGDFTRSALLRLMSEEDIPA